MEIIFPRSVLMRLVISTPFVMSIASRIGEIKTHFLGDAFPSAATEMRMVTDCWTTGLLQYETAMIRAVQQTPSERSPSPSGNRNWAPLMTTRVVFGGTSWEQMRPLWLVLNRTNGYMTNLSQGHLGNRMC